MFSIRANIKNSLFYYSFLSLFVFAGNDISDIFQSAGDPWECPMTPRMRGPSLIADLRRPRRPTGPADPRSRRPQRFSGTRTLAYKSTSNTLNNLQNEYSITISNVKNWFINRLDHCQLYYASRIYITAID